MKIGILTFHCAHNYGAVLQCYALQEFLKGLGHDVNVIDYRPSYLNSYYKAINIRANRNIFKVLKNIIGCVLKYSRNVRRIQAFNTFIEGRLSLSPFCEKTIVSDFDAYIFGSDQIWNPRISDGFDEIFWGNLPFVKGNKKYISYAASMGKDSLTENEKERITEYLRNIDAISVRENILKSMLAPLTDKNVLQVLDPTLLAPRSVWDKLEDKIEERGYVLVYQVRKNENTMEIAKHIARQLNTKVITLVSGVSWSMERNKKSCASPEDFVSYFKHASCIVTTSFHGTAFSVIFNKPFYCIELGDGADGRSKSLLHSLHLGDRMIDKLARPSFTEVDYTEASKHLNGLRKNSEHFLTENLK